MAKLSAHGTEIARYLHNGTLRSVRSDGTTMQQGVYDRRWRLRARKRADMPLDQWKEAKLLRVAALPAWARNVKHLPSLRQLEEWVSEGVCESVTGDRCEPDGSGPDGDPSWLVALGMI